MHPALTSIRLATTWVAPLFAAPPRERLVDVVRKRFTVPASIAGAALGAHLIAQIFMREHSTLEYDRLYRGHPWFAFDVGPDLATRYWWASTPVFYVALLFAFAILSALTAWPLWRSFEGRVPVLGMVARLGGASFVGMVAVSLSTTLLLQLSHALHVVAPMGPELAGTLFDIGGVITTFLCSLSIGLSMLYALPSILVHRSLRTGTLQSITTSRVLGAVLLLLASWGVAVAHANPHPWGWTAPLALTLFGWGSVELTAFVRDERRARRELRAILTGTSTLMHVAGESVAVGDTLPLAPLDGTPVVLVAGPAHGSFRENAGKAVVGLVPGALRDWYGA